VKCQSSERPEAQCSTRVGLQANKHLQSGTWVATGAARCQPTGARLAPAFLFAGTSHRVRAGRLPPDLPCADTVAGGPAPVRAYIDELLPDVLEGRIEPGRVFDQVTNLEGVPDGYRAMNEREAIKVLIEL
jgi:hypothetical protein